MEKPSFSCAILPKLNLCSIKKVVKEAFHKEGCPGRPPRHPMGIFKALIISAMVWEVLYGRGAQAML